MTRKASFFSAAALLAASLCAPTAFSQTLATQTSGTQLPDVDRQFLQTASQSSSTEIDASKLATRQSADKDVKNFANTMIADHTRLALELKSAAPKGIDVPQNNPDTAVIDALKPLRGSAFDSAYLQKVGVQAHKDAIDMFRTEATHGQVPALKAPSQKALPIIEGHYRMAQKLAQKKGVAQ